MSHRQRRLQIPRRVSSVAASASATSSGHVNNRDRLPTVDRILEDHQTPARPSDSRTPAERSLQTTPDIRTTAGPPLSSILETDNDPPFREPLLHVPPPSGIESRLSAQELRQRASSPLLGQFPRRNNASASPLPFHPKPKPLRVAESASSLHSFYDPQHSPPLSTEQTPSEQSDLSLRNYFPAPPTSHSASDIDNGAANMTFRLSDHRPSSKSKLRPPMIDLSRLFPKPKEQSVPLLSPNRMMASPSPVSMLSDDSTAKTTLKFERFYKGGGGNKLTKVPGRKDSTLIRKQQKQQEQLLRQEHEAQIKEQQRRQREALERLEEEQERQRQLQLEELLRQQAELRRKQNRQSGVKPLEPYVQRVPKPFRTETDKANKLLHTRKRRPAFSHWFDGPEGQISDEDEDEEFDIVAEAHASELPGDTEVKQTFCESVYSHANSFSSSIPSNTVSGLSSSNRTLRVPSTTSVTASSRNRNASPGRLYPDSTRNTSTRDWEGGSPCSQSVESPSVTNKRSTMALNSSNLNESSVLCLSSSEDEDDDNNSKTGNRTFVRDSIATFDEGEICTARTAIAATRRPSIRSVRASGISQNRMSRPTERVRQPLKREPSVSSSTHSSNIGRVNASRGSSCVPTISEPNVSSPISSTQSFDFHLPRPRPRSRVSGQQTPDRRSRFLAVTRQEEYLLEILRKNKGVFPPNLFGNDNESVTSGDPEGKFNNRQSLSSYYSDASLLRLGSNLPPSRRPSQISQIQSSNRTSEVAPSYTGGSEYGDLATDCSNTSPRASLVHSDTMTSPSTGLASPRTPRTTGSYVNHRVSLTNPHPPPPFSPPPVPEQHRHSRTRTDSSSAIIFPNNGGGEKETHAEDLPIWALGWNQELSGLAVAH